MQLLIVRHGDAENRANSDKERALTEKGRQQARAVGSFLSARSLQPVVFFSSHYRRARETAEEIQRIIGGDIIEEKRLGCGATADDYLTIIDAYASSPTALFVGHNPDCAEITAFFTGALVDFKKAALAVIELYKPHRNGGVLTAFVPPKFMDE